MNSQADPRAGGRLSIPRERGRFEDYRRLTSTLAAKATRWGSRDPENAAQEALRRSFENPKSRQAIEYYLSDNAAAHDVPEWQLERLLAWLHGVLQFVVREEQSRAAFQREVPTGATSDPADSSRGVLEAMMERETRAMVDDCFAKLSREYREVLTLRLDGLRYGEIARRLGTNENTVATWVSRGMRQLGRRIRKRMDGSHE